MYCHDVQLRFFFIFFFFFIFTFWLPCYTFHFSIHCLPITILHFVVGFNADSVSGISFVVCPFVYALVLYLLRLELQPCSDRFLYSCLPCKVILRNINKQSWFPVRQVLYDVLSIMKEMWWSLDDQSRQWYRVCGGA